MSNSTFPLTLNFQWKPYAGTRTDWDRIRNDFFTAEVYQDEDGTWTWGIGTRDDLENGYGYETRELAQRDAQSRLSNLFMRVTL